MTPRAESRIETRALSLLELITHKLSLLFHMECYELKFTIISVRYYTQSQHNRARGEHVNRQEVHFRASSPNTTEHVENT